MFDKQLLRPRKGCDELAVAFTLDSVPGPTASIRARAHYRYKRPPRKRKPNPAALAMPAVVIARRGRHTDAAAQVGPSARSEEKEERAGNSPAPANDDRKSAIVTVRRRKHAALSAALDMTRRNMQAARGCRRCVVPRDEAPDRWERARAIKTGRRWNAETHDDRRSKGRGMGGGAGHSHRCRA
jgi:hypothetical protein